jgi:hypothetical protein
MVLNKDVSIIMFTIAPPFKETNPGFVRFEVFTVVTMMLRRVALLTTDVSEELSASIIRVTRIGELGTTLAVTSKFLQEPHGVTSQKTPFFNPGLCTEGSQFKVETKMDCPSWPKTHAPSGGGADIWSLQQRMERQTNICKA